MLECVVFQGCKLVCRNHAEQMVCFFLSVSLKGGRGRLLAFDFFKTFFCEFIVAQVVYHRFAFTRPFRMFSIHLKTSFSHSPPLGKRSSTWWTASPPATSPSGVPPSRCPPPASRRSASSWPSCTSPPPTSGPRGRRRRSSPGCTRRSSGQWRRSSSEGGPWRTTRRRRGEEGLSPPLFFVIPGARLSRTPSLSGTFDASLQPGGRVVGRSMGSKLLRDSTGI